MKARIEVRGEWAGEVGSSWRPACAGTVNQTGQTDAEASTFDTVEEAKETLVQFEYDSSCSVNEAAEFRIVEVES